MKNQFQFRGFTGMLCAALISACCCFAAGTSQGKTSETEKTFVTGCVTDMQGIPISGAKLSIFDPYSQGSLSGFAETISDDKGRFSIAAPPAKCKLSVHAQGYASMHRTQLVGEGENRGWDFMLPRSARVSGMVLDTKGKLQAKRTLGLTEIQGAPPSEPGMGFYANGSQGGGIATDENGVFDMLDVAPGKYSIIVYGSSSEGDGWGMYQEPVKGGFFKVESGDRVENFEIVVNPPEEFAISGHVRDASSNPLHKIYVSTSIPHGSQWWSNTNEHGKFCIRGLDGMNLSSFRLSFKGTTIDCESFELVIPDVPLNSKDLELTVPGRGTIQAKVRNAKSGDPVTSCNLTVPLVKLPESGAVWENPQVQIETNSDASYTISGVPAGEATVEVNADGLGTGRFTTAVEAGKTSVLECGMPKPAAVEHRITPATRFLKPIEPGDPREAGEIWAIPAADGRLRISPMRQWSKTGIEVSKGQILEIQAEGSVQGCQGPENEWAYGPWGPEGGPSDNDPDSLVCALIGRIDGQGKSHEFIVGEKYKCEISADGKLELGVSDVWHYDNSGEFLAEIRLDGNPVDFMQHEAATLTAPTENLAASMQPRNGAYVSDGDGAWSIGSQRGDHRPMIETDQLFHPPLEIRARARTDSTNIRLYYGSFGNGMLIFNWEVNPDELRIHDPATGAIGGISGRGGIEQDKFHNIVWRIGTRRMQVLVDGEERYRSEGDYSAVVSPVGIGPALGSRVDVESLVVAPLDPGVMDVTVPTPKETKTEIAGSNKTSPYSGKPSLKASNRDDLVGWYKLPSRTGGHRIVPGSYILIPVFKHSGSYWTVSWPGAEIPLKECPEGLEWAIKPSSMEGTKIRYDKASNMYSIIIRDSQAMNYSDNSEEPEWQPVTKVNEPEGLLNPRAKRPRTNDDFTGWYQGVWLPVSFEIRKQEEKYIVTGQKPFYEEPRELAPLPDRLGFVLEERERVNLTYNEDLKRYELTITGDKKIEPALIRIPLARIPAPPPNERDVPPGLNVRIGIPCWH